jgi:hypothetical protein
VLREGYVKVDRRPRAVYVEADQIARWMKREYD